MTAPSLQPRTPPLDLAPKTGPAIDIQTHAESGRWRASIRLPTGERVALHRVDDPLGEAHAQLATCGATDPRVIAVVGAGLGFLTEAAFERFPNARIVVLEPIPPLADSARARTPALYASGRVRVVVGPAFDGGDLWRLFDVEDPNEPDPALLLNPALQRAIPAAMTTAVLLMRRAVAAARMNARARRDNAGRYVLNTLRNLPHIINGADPQRLVGHFRGVPAVLVAAGPSLDRNLDTLRQCQQRALIVATDTTWRPLVSAGIDPHCVVSLDPSPLNGRHLAGVAARRETWILAEGSVDPDVLHAFEGRVATFRVGMHHPWPWLSELGVDRPLARVWGSVLTAVFDLSLSFGCDPLIFIGADLAYTDERPYCRGTSFERDWARHAAGGVSLRQVWHNTVSARAAVTEADVHGQDTHTAAHLVEFRNWLLAHAGKHADRQVVNATGAGILHGPAIGQTDLATALGGYPDRGDALRNTIHELFGRRTVSIHQRPVLDALATIDEATAADQTAPATSPVSEWLAFGKPSLTIDDIHIAATKGRTSLEHAWPGRTFKARATDPVEAPALLLHEADRVARMRALLTKDQSVLDGCAQPNSPGSPRPRQAGVWDMSYILSVLLAMPRLTDDGRDTANAPPAVDIPLSCRFAWTSSAAPWVAALEELLLGDPELATPGTVSHPVDDNFWSGQIAPVLDPTEHAGEDPPEDDAHRARRELTSLRLRLLDEEYATSHPREQRLAQALLHGASTPALRLPSQAPYRLDLVARGAATSLPVRIDALMRALTGTLAWAGERRSGSEPGTKRVWSNVRAVAASDDADTDPRLTFLAADVDFVEPDVLTARGLPRGFSLSAIANDRVLFVPNGSTESRHIAPDGSVEAGSQWPVAITGEIPWGGDGGALAWNVADSTVLLRPRAGVAPLVESAPFQPMRVAPAPDGTAFWSAYKGGVWTWLPGQSGRLLIDTPTWGRILLEGNDLVLPPIVVPDDHGRVTRQRLRYEWRCALDSLSLRRVDAAREGQCYGVASRGRWTARAFPFSDLIRLDSSGGDALLLACHAPTNIAWAGDSLVVGTGEGTVLMFRSLLDRLTALCPTASAETD